MEKTNKRIVFGLVLSCWLIYTFSMCLKMAYSGAMASIKEEYGVSNVTASLPLTLYYAFYAMVQFVLAIFMTKIHLKAYMAVTFIFSALSFISVFFFSPVWYVSTVLAVNGITLGAVWCGSILVFGKYLSRKTMNNALLFMGVGFAVGNAMAFGISALAATLGNWRISFIVFGVAFLLSTLYFLFSLTRVEKAGIKPDDEKIVFKKQVYMAEKSDVKPLIIMAIITVFFSCVLYYAFTNWMPTILKNVFHISNAKANLITTLFPIVVYLGPILGTTMSNKVKNDFLVTVIACAVSMVFSLILYLVFDINVVLTVVVILILGVFLRLLNNLFGAFIPLHTREYVNSGKTAAIINAVASIAAAASPFLISLILDASGNDWSVGFFVLFLFAAIMLLVSTIFLIMCEIKRRKEKTAKNAV